MSCICEPPEGDEGSIVAYSSWIAEGLGLCVYTADLRDVIGFIFIAIHGVAWFLLFFPQLWKNYSNRSASNLSLLYLSFWVFSEVCFLIATALEHWSWFWLGFRIWRTVMTTLLLIQSIYYKYCLRNDFAAAVEAPFARGGRTQDGYFQHEDVEYEEAASMGWPVRKGREPNLDRSMNHSGGTLNQQQNGNHSIAMNKSAFYGVAPSMSPWGESLLGASGGGTPPLRPSATLLSSSPNSRSRLPSSHAHLSTQPPPRTISPTISPKMTTRTLPKGSYSGSNSGSSSPISSSHAVNPTTMPAAIPSIDNERRRAAYAARQSHTTVKVQRHSNSPNAPLITTGFHTSPTSAFSPITHASTHSDANLDLYDNSNSTDSIVSQKKGGGGGGGKLYTMAICMVGLIMWSASGHLELNSSMSQSMSRPANLPTTVFNNPPSTSRILLSIDAAATAASFTPLDVASLSDATPSFCNQPYAASDNLLIVLRILGWLGCVCSAISFFPQYMYNDSYIKSVSGLSFGMYAWMMIGNLSFLIGVTLPTHSDWLDNRYTHDDGTFQNWYLNDIVLPIIIAHGFNFLQIIVFWVQRARFRNQQVLQSRR